MKPDPLLPEQQIQLKEGKTFWTWNSPAGNQSIHYVEKGTGSKHIILIHGFRAYSYTWRHLVEPLAQAGFHVWAIDMIGYGLSDKPEASYKPDFFLKQIKAFMDDHAISQAHFIGNSMGGGLSLCMALSYPQYINSLTLISALGYPLELPFYVRLCKDIDGIWPPFLGPTMIRKGLEQIVYHKEVITDEQVQAYALPYRLPGGSESALNTLRNFDNQILKLMRSGYKNVQCPVLIIWGDQDQLIPLEHYHHFCRDFPFAQKQLLKDCGHIPQEEQPEEVKNQIIKFLNSYYKI